MPSTPASTQDYLAALPDDKRAALTTLRATIRRIVPKAEECISYQLPAFRLDGRVLLWFGASARHCSFYPGAYPIKVCRADLVGYDTSKGTIRFPPAKPLPAALVRKLVKARVAEFATPRATGAVRRRSTRARRPRAD